jgi:prepilin-type N-terminal cleavage/methylation domain-containing protein
MINKFKPNSNKGFTLVEMIVAVGLFVVVMFIATGALLSVVNLNKKAQAQQSAINNLNNVMENIARSIRTGSTYHCGTSGTITVAQDCSSGDSYLAYESDGTDGPADPLNDADQRIFRLNSGVIEKSKDSGGTWMPITDDNIVIEDLTFVVTGTVTKSNGNSSQPQVKINISGYAFVSENSGSPRRVNFSLQTMASQRMLDN